VGFHHGIVPGGAIALLGKSPTIVGPFCLCGCLHGCPSSILKKHEGRTSFSGNNRSDLGGANHCKAVSVVIRSATANASETPMPDTIKTETTLIEEDALMAESLRFEGEPRTRFYLAGEIIRELRNASGKQSHYASGGNMAHSDKVIDHYDHPCDVGSLPKGDPDGNIGLVGARVDVMELQMRINSEAQVIEEGECKTVGCGPAPASASLPTEPVNGKTERRHWPSRTRISSPSSAFPCALLSDATRYPRIGARQR
jgi:hypothetical protein